MKKTILTLFVCALSTLFYYNANAQSYKYAAGLKFTGYENGIAGKYFLDQTNALEGMIGFRSGGVVISGLYEVHQTAFNVAELKFYYGAGAHLGAIGSGRYQRYSGDDEFYSGSSILLGADATLGLEYVIPNSPIAVSLDLNPRVELARGPFFDIAPGLGLKYVFK